MMYPKNWSDLTEQQQLGFVESFYNCWSAEFPGFDDDIKSSPQPWGMPWLYRPDDVSVDAKTFFDGIKTEIKRHLEPIA